MEISFASCPGENFVTVIGSEGKSFKWVHRQQYKETMVSNSAHPIQN